MFSLACGPFKTVDELELATMDWMHGFNEHRWRSSIGYPAPIEAEQQYREMNPQRHNVVTPGRRPTALH